MDVGTMLAVLGRELGIGPYCWSGRTNGPFFQAGLTDVVSRRVAPRSTGRRRVRARLSLAEAERLDHGLVHLRSRGDQG